MRSKDCVAGVQTADRRPRTARFGSPSTTYSPTTQTTRRFFMKAPTDRYFVYLPQSFPGIVWHQQLVGAAAAAFGVVVGAGETRETRNTIQVSAGILFPFLEITSR